MTQRLLFNNPEADSKPVSQEKLEELIALQSALLAAVVSSEKSDILLAQLCRFAEKLVPDSVASVTLLDQNQQRLFVHTAPSIPVDAITELNGLEVGDGSCGNAVFHNENMYVVNTLDDIRWENLRDFAQRYKVHACWSSPVRNAANESIGSFALSSFAKRKPDNFQRKLLTICASISGIILQREAELAEKKQHKRQLWESRQNLAATIDSIADGVISTDIHGDIVVFNQLAEALTGWPRKMATGQNIDVVFTLLNRQGETIDCHPAGILAANENFRDDNNFMLVSAYGKKYPVALSKALIKDEHDEISGVVIAFRDVSALQRSREALLNTQQRYWSIMENVADPLFLINQQREFVDVNQAACEKLGYSLETLLTMTVADIETSMDGEVFDTLPLGHSVILTGTHRRKAGTEFPVEVRIRKFMSNNEALAVVLATDISKRKQEEEATIKARKLESIGLLAGGIAHDFNNLLGIVLGNIDLVQRCDGLSDKAEKYLANAINASRRATDLTRQLLTFSKGGDPIQQSADIVEVIRESTAFSLHGKNIEVNYDFPDDLWRANIDSGQISQVIQNLVINASQAMAQGGRLAIGCKNTVVTEDDNPGKLLPGRYLRVKVKDTGCGIPEDILHAVFDPYFTTKQQGNGLGLALTYSIIRKHGGDISVSSVPGQGTTFTLYLPVAEAENNRQQTSPTQHQATAHARILVMDDDAMITEISQAMLEDLGYEVVLAAEGETAIQRYQEAMVQGRKIDLVIMDLTIIGGMGGQETIKQLIKIDPQVNALVSSGYSNDDVMAHYKRYGFKGTISKPYTQQVLATAIQTVLIQ